MLTEPTIDKLHALRLGAMAAAWTAQHEDPKMNEIDFDGRFGILHIRPDDGASSGGAFG